MAYLRVYLFLFILLKISLSVSYGQATLVKKWDRRFGGSGWDELFSLQQTFDGGYILGGDARSGMDGDVSQPRRDTGIISSDGDYWMVKTDAFGNKQWDRRFGGEAHDVMMYIVQARDSGYLLAGYTYSDSSGDISQRAKSTVDIWVIKTDVNGNKRWDRRYGGNGWSFLYTAKQTRDDGFILGGYTFAGAGGDVSEDSRGGYDYWIIKIDSAGTKKWDHRFGGSNHDQLLTLDLTRDGGYILGGQCYSDSGGDVSEKSRGGQTDYWMVKTDSLGNKQWDKRFGGDNFEQMQFVTQTRDGGYILGGNSQSDSSGDITQHIRGMYDWWVVKTDSVGKKQWDKRYGGPGIEDQIGTIKQLMNGDYFITGTSYSQAGGDKTESDMGNEQGWIVKTDSLGNKRWDKTITTYSYSVDDEGGLALIDQYGDIVLGFFSQADSGLYKTQNSRGSWDYWIIKFRDTTVPIAPVRIDNIDGYAASCATACNGGVKASVSGGIPPYTFQWQPVVDNRDSLSNLCAGMYYVTVMDIEGRHTSDSVYVPTLIKDPFPIQYDKNALCRVNDTAHICALSGFAQYHWSNGGSTGCIAAVLPGNYRVTVTDEIGCTVGSSAVFVSLYPQTDNSITANNRKICSGDSARICAANGLSGYQWNDGDSSRCTMAKEGGDYYVTVTDANGCTAQSSHIPLTVYPVSSISVVVRGDTLVSFDSQQYQWIKDGVPVPGATSNIYIAIESGDYAVEITDTNGCHVTSNPVTANVNSISDLSDKEISVYPNPSAEGWQLSVGTAYLGSQLEMYDDNGRLVYSSVIDQQHSLLSPVVSTGIYWLQISNANGNVVRKLVKLK